MTTGTIFLTSQRNSMKRDETSGTVRLAAPSTSAYSGTLRVTNYTVAHNLGYPPLFRYYYEPFGDGTIWPPLADRLTGYASKPTNLATSGPGIIAWVDSTNLYIQLFFYDASLTATYPVYWVIYKDYAL